MGVGQGLNILGARRCACDAIACVAAIAAPLVSSLSHALVALLLCRPSVLLVVLAGVLVFSDAYPASDLVLLLIQVLLLLLLLLLLVLLLRLLLLLLLFRSHFGSSS